MIRVLFLCHGNICRSPMAEFLMKYKIKNLNKGDLFEISSKATSREEIGNDIHYGTKKILDKYNIPYSKRCASQITKADILYYDYIICMDKNNISNLIRMFGENSKFEMLLERDVLDPWYTGDFERTYEDINSGLDKLIEKLV